MPEPGYLLGYAWWWRSLWCQHPRLAQDVPSHEGRQHRDGQRRLQGQGIIHQDGLHPHGPAEASSRSRLHCMSTP
jgi:hypothetical protein